MHTHTHTHSLSVFSLMFRMDQTKKQLVHLTNSWFCLQYILILTGEIPEITGIAKPATVLCRQHWLTWQASDWPDSSVWLAVDHWQCLAFVPQSLPSDPGWCSPVPWSGLAHPWKYKGPQCYHNNDDEDSCPFSVCRTFPHAEHIKKDCFFKNRKGSSWR